MLTRQGEEVYKVKFLWSQPDHENKLYAKTSSYYNYIIIKAIKKNWVQSKPGHFECSNNDETVIDYI